jgi:hypothetical protein
MRAGFTVMALGQNNTLSKGKVETDNIKRIINKEFTLVDQTVNSTYYCDFCGDCMKMCKDFTNWLLHHDNAPPHTFFFAVEFFTQNNMTVTHTVHPTPLTWLLMTSLSFSN